MKALKQRDSKEALIKLLKITDEQAEIILSMQVRSLASKNQDDLRSKIKKCKEVIKDWGKKKKHMTSHLATTFETYAGKLTNAVIGLKAQSNNKSKKRKSKKRK
jgi:DNA gyrase/topoisomerase IV subunit A